MREVNIHTVIFLMNRHQALDKTDFPRQIVTASKRKRLGSVCTELQRCYETAWEDVPVQSQVVRFPQHEQSASTPRTPEDDNTCTMASLTRCCFHTGDPHAVGGRPRRTSVMQDTRECVVLFLESKSILSQLRLFTALADKFISEQISSHISDITG